MAEGCAGILNNTAGNTIAATNTYFNVVNTTPADTCTLPSSQRCPNCNAVPLSRMAFGQLPHDPSGASEIRFMF